MIVIHKSNGELVILGTEQETMLRLAVDFAITEGELNKTIQLKRFPYDQDDEHEDAIEKLRALRRTLS